MIIYDFIILVNDPSRYTVVTMIETTFTLITTGTVICRSAAVSSSSETVSRDIVFHLPALNALNFLV